MRLNISCAALGLTVMSCTALVPAQPAATQSATEPATRPAITLYACVLGPGGLAMTGDAVAGLPVLQQVEPQFFATKLAYAKKNGLGIFLDYELPNPPTRGIAVTREVSQLANLDAYVGTLHTLLRNARAGGGSADSPRLIGAYTDLPIGQRWQYDDDQQSYIADNRRVAAADPFRDADVICVHAYLHGDDIPWMTPEAAATFARRRIAAARFYGKPIMLFVSPTWLHTKPAKDVSDELLSSMLKIARDEQVDVCIWSDVARDTVEAKREVTRVTAVRDAVGR